MDKALIPKANEKICLLAVSGGSQSSIGVGRNIKGKLLNDIKVGKPVVLIDNDWANVDYKTSLVEEVFIEDGLTFIKTINTLYLIDN